MSCRNAEAVPEEGVRVLKPPRLVKNCYVYDAYKIARDNFMKANGVIDQTDDDGYPLCRG